MTMSKLNDLARASFARHETFAPRVGWLHKAYLSVKDDPETFLKEDATVRLGVGKNMVNAIRLVTGVQADGGARKGRQLAGVRRIADLAGAVAAR